MGWPRAARPRRDVGGGERKAGSDASPGAPRSPVLGGRRRGEEILDRSRSRGRGGSSGRTRASGRRNRQDEPNPPWLARRKSPERSQFRRGSRADESLKRTQFRRESRADKSPERTQFRRGPRIRITKSNPIPPRPARRRRGGRPRPSRCIQVRAGGALHQSGDDPASARKRDFVRGRAGCPARPTGSSRTLRVQRDRGSRRAGTRFAPRGGVRIRGGRGVGLRGIRSA